MVSYGWPALALNRGAVSSLGGRWPTATLTAAPCHPRQPLLCPSESTPSRRSTWPTPTMSYSAMTCGISLLQRSAPTIFMVSPFVSTLCLPFSSRVLTAGLGTVLTSWGKWGPGMCGGGKWHFWPQSWRDFLEQFRFWPLVESPLFLMWGVRVCMHVCVCVSVLHLWTRVGWIYVCRFL